MNQQLPLTPGVAHRASPFALSTLRRAARLALAGGLPVLASLAVHAQSQPAAKPATPDTSTLQTVTVTAEKVAAPEQKTPISMSVHGGEELASQGVSDLKSLATIAPDLSYGESSSSMPVLTVRGISSRDTTEIGDPAVSVSVDGTYSNRPYGLNATMYDLDRVEVLRGPQGTLFGRNATGGALNIVTAEPGKTFGGYGAIDVGNYMSRNFDGAVNVPLSKSFAMRAAFSSRRHDGYMANGAGDEDSNSARLSFLFEPNADLKARLTLQTTSLRGIGSLSFQSPFVLDPNGFRIHDGITPPDPNSYFPLSPALAYLQEDENLARWQVSYGLGAVDIHFIGGYSAITYHHGDDQYSAGNIKGFIQNEHPKTQNYELRFSSKPGGALAWQAGLFHFEENSGLSSYNATLGAAGAVVQGFSFQYATVAKSDAVFGQVSFKPTESLKLTAGLRDTRDDKSRVGFYYIPGVFSVNQASQAKFSKLTGHLGADWELDARTMLYAKYDTGYKAGGFTDVAPYGPENVKGPEIGLKTRMLDNKLQLNVSAFDYEYTGQQVSQFVPSLPNAPSGGTLIINAGRTKISGLEADVTAIAGSAGRVNVSLALLHARFSDFVAQMPNANGLNVNAQLAGHRPPQSPNAKLALGWEKSIDLGAGSITPRIDANYTSGQYFTFWNNATDFQKAYAMVNAAVTWAPADGKWSLQAYVRNAANKRVYTEAEDNGFFNSYRWTYNAPRTIGAKLTAYW
ncbi:MAG: TonB-dependent receptor [Burkholderiales bacterium]|nr:TonB-dependent receptor [Burkholderiales bacterium]